MAFYFVSLGALMAGVFVFAVFRDDTAQEARERIALAFHAVASWPGRFIRYRSGHGRHAIV